MSDDDFGREVVANPLSSDDTSSHYQQIRANPVIVITNAGIKIRRIHLTSHLSSRFKQEQVALLKDIY